MKILVVTQYYWPEYFQVTAECEELAQRGHSVTVLTGLPNYPSGVIPKEYRYGRNRTQLRNGVEIIRVPLIARGKNPVRLAFNYHSFAWFSKRAAGKLPDDFDVVYVPEISPVTMIEAAALYKKRHGTPLLVYCCDLWPESLKNILGNHGKPIVDFYGKISKRLYSEADLLPVQSPAFSQYLERVHGIPAEKTPFLPQFGDSEYLSMNFNVAHEGINFLVMGNMGRAQDIPVILNAVLKMSHKRGFTVHFVGDGSCFEETKSFVRANGLSDRVILHGRKPHEDMPGYYENADACILTLNGDTWIGSTVPSRLQGYMAAGKPVIAAINGGAQTIIAKSNCGAFTGAGDVDGLALLLDDYISFPGKYERCGENGRSFFESNFSREHHIDELEKMLISLYKENKRV